MTDPGDAIIISSILLGCFYILGGMLRTAYNRYLIESSEKFEELKEIMEDLKDHDPSRPPTVRFGK